MRIAGSGGGYRIVARSESFAETAAAFLARKLAALGARGPVSVALSGGSTPGPVYRLLARSPLPPWDRMTIYFADERAVPRDHPESNYRLLRETLLEPAGIGPELVRPMIPEGWNPPSRDLDPSSVLDRLAPLASDYADSLPERLDLIVLGLGEDGHTASLFPGAPAVEERERRILAVEGPTEPRYRLTITPPEIARSRLVIVLARGEAKRDAVQRASTPGPAIEVPGRLANKGIWLIGRDAATRTRRPEPADGAS